MLIKRRCLPVKRCCKERGKTRELAAFCADTKHVIRTYVRPCPILCAEGETAPTAFVRVSASRGSITVSRVLLQTDMCCNVWPVALVCADRVTCLPIVFGSRLGPEGVPLLLQRSGNTETISYASAPVVHA